MVTTATFDVIVVGVAEALVPVWVAVAVMFTVPLFVVGTTFGAVYTPTCASVVEGTMVPTVELPPDTLFTCQVTAVLVEIVVPVDVEVLLKFTVAVNSDCELRGTDAVVGVMAIDVIVAVVLLLFLLQDETPKTTPAIMTMPKARRSAFRIKASRSRRFAPKRRSRTAGPKN